MEYTKHMFPIYSLFVGQFDFHCNAEWWIVSFFFFQIILTGLAIAEVGGDLHKCSDNHSGEYKNERYKSLIEKYIVGINHILCLALYAHTLFIHVTIHYTLSV